MRKFSLVAVPLLAALGCGGSDASPPSQGAAGAGGSAGSAGKAATPPPSVELVGVSVTQVADVALMKDGAALEPTVAPVVEGKPGFFRVYVKTSKAFGSRKVKADVRVLQADGAEATYTATAVLTHSSDVADPRSTVNVAAPADAFRVGATYSARVFLNDEEQGHFPSDGEAVLPVEHVNESLKVVLVPFRYDADGSGRLPDVASMVEPFRQRMASMYPTPAVEITVHDPVPYAKPLGATDDDDWGTYLDTLLTLREDEGASPDVYYYAVMAPRPSFWQFCGQGCIAGLALGSLGKKTDPTHRGAVGVGYDDSFAADTFVHEIGHTHGILHAPCGNPASVDKKFPYPSGTIGTVGWDASNDEWFRGDEAHDVMAYCEDRWVSDYVYGKLAREMQVVAAATAMAHHAPEPWLRVRVDAAGQLVPSSAREVSRRSTGDDLGAVRSVRMGTTLVPARFVPYADAKGGVVYLPKGSAPQGVIEP